MNKERFDALDQYIDIFILSFLRTLEKEEYVLIVFK